MVYWNPNKKYDYYFATKYKNHFICFGIQNGLSEATSSHHSCIVSGNVAVQEGKEVSYSWLPTPDLNLELHVRREKVQLCGGYACGNEMKIFTVLTKPGTFKVLTETQCWSRSLTIPSLATSLSPPQHLHEEWTPADPTIVPTSLVLLVVQKCRNHVVYFYCPQSSSEDGDVLSNAYTVIIATENHQQSCRFSSDVNFSKYINCAAVGADIFIVNGNKMAKVEDFESLIAANNTERASSIQFNIPVPHTDGTLFVVQDTLCTAGGRDQDYDEPFSNICQFDRSTQDWHLCGSLTSSRYGASAVVLTDETEKEVVFIAGGFKGNDIPCSLVEIFSVATA